MDIKTKIDRKQLRIFERIGDGGQGSAVYKGVVVKTSHDNDGEV